MVSAVAASPVGAGFFFFFLVGLILCLEEISKLQWLHVGNYVFDLPYDSILS